MAITVSTRALWIALGLSACSRPEPLEVSIAPLPRTDLIFQIPEAPGWVGWNFGLSISARNGLPPAIDRIELAYFSGKRELERAMLERDVLVAHRVDDPKHFVVRDFDWRMKEELAVTSVEVRAFSGEQASQPVHIPLVRYIQKNTFRLPLDGCWYVSSAQGLGQEHRRWYNRAHFAWDLVRVGPNGNSFREDGRTVEDYYAWGEIVLAPAAGKIVLADDTHADNIPGVVGRTEDANSIMIDHGEGEFSKLAHLAHSSLLVRRGDRVRRGQPLARIGNSGMSDAPHLHFHVQETIFDATGRIIDERPLPILIGAAGVHPRRGEFICAEE